MIPGGILLPEEYFTADEINIDIRREKSQKGIDWIDLTCALVKTHLSLSASE